MASDHERQHERRIESGHTTLLWGEAAACKARLGAESETTFEELPLAERLRRALSMVARRSGDARPR